jgi:hypothetical protein
MNKWLTRLLGYEEINGGRPDDTYLKRWRFLRLGSISIYLHHFIGDDWARDMHDHPKRFISIGLWGEYVEETPYEPTTLYELIERSPRISARPYHAPWIRSFPATHRHRLTLGPEGERRGCWTLVLTGMKSRDWYFYPPDSEPVPWKEYVATRTARGVEA